MNAILYPPKTSCQWRMIPKARPNTSQSPPPPTGEKYAGEDCNGGNEAKKRKHPHSTSKKKDLKTKSSRLGGFPGRDEKLIFQFFQPNKSECVPVPVKRS